MPAKRRKGRKPGPKRKRRKTRGKWSRARKGSKFRYTVGSRAMVYHGTAKRTSGGLTKKNLMRNKRKKIVSKKQHRLGYARKARLKPLTKEQAIILLRRARASKAAKRAIRRRRK